MYGTLVDAGTYHADRGNVAWAAGSAPDRTAALVRATDYIDGRYRHRLKSGRWQSMFPGERTAGRGQANEWPRTGATDYDGNEIASDEVPIEVKHATYEAALRELTVPGSLSPDFVPSGQVIREKVDVVEIGYAAPVPTGNSTPNRPVIPMIDEIIAPVVLRPADYPAVRVV